MSSDEQTKGIRANIILDVIGRPPEHLVDTLKKIGEKITEEKGVKIIEEKIKDPVELENQKEFYSSFSEIELEVENISVLVSLIFRYMPAHVEVISPELIALTNQGWGDILSEITRRLHGYDEVARVIQSEKKILENKLKSLMDSKENKEISKDED
jgi:hypothetical protein